MTPKAWELVNDPEWLRTKYVTEGLGIYGIAKSLGCSDSTVRLRLYRFGIPIRNRRQAEPLIKRIWSEKQRAAMSKRRRGKNNPMYGQPVLSTRGQNWDPDPQVARKNAHRASKYGITGVEYAAMLAAQKGVCAICKMNQAIVTAKGHVWDLAIDHDHETGLVRGLLCHYCNVMLGNAHDDPKILRRAISYLAKDWPALREKFRVERVWTEPESPIRPRKPIKERTHCKRGHELTPENTQNRGGLLICKECRHINGGFKQRRSKTHCPNGHPWRPETTYRLGNHKTCRLCRSEREWRATHPDAKPYKPRPRRRKPDLSTSPLG